MNSLVTSLRAAAVAAIFVGFVASSAVAATNLVTNGGFETGDFTGWTQSGNVGFSGVGGGANASSGTSGAFFGPIGTMGFLSQTLTTVVGTVYQFDYSLANFGGTPNAFQVSVNGSIVHSLSNAGAFSHTPSASHLFVASSTSTTLQFGFRHDPNFWALDDVSVIQSSTIPGTPDSGSTVALLGLALTLVACVRRRLA